MKRVPIAVVLTVALSGCGYVQSQVITGQPLPSGTAPADACAPQNLAAMAGKPATAAIAANPGLSGMLAGLDRAGLRTLDDAPALTLFATSDRFLAYFPFRNIPALWDNPKELAQILKQAAVGERLDPARLPGTHTTMGGTRVIGGGEPGSLRVNDTKVVCQQLGTANAAVYIVDQLVTQR
ncbi:fasciclin domain-containing protein [Winogradskya humida]|uniref:FAS1 domain-containing protein n=1 Tax=Winogradskya humida TaxID=113566 RepID=A0ABQ3ZY92_9ACTN|nr:fasciclin domain-containing protein [Actinoplanes humidus]GIE23549.1 hypothetical protein Ahu01nite_066510 [Actinoplanes humidus]